MTTIPPAPPPPPLSHAMNMTVKFYDGILLQKWFDSSRMRIISKCFVWYENSAFWFHFCGNIVEYKWSFELNWTNECLNELRAEIFDCEVAVGLCCIRKGWLFRCFKQIFEWHGGHRWFEWNIQYSTGKNQKNFHRLIKPIKTKCQADITNFMPSKHFIWKFMANWISATREKINFKQILMPAMMELEWAIATLSCGSCSGEKHVEIHVELDGSMPHGVYQIRNSGKTIETNTK